MNVVNHQHWRLNGWDWYYKDYYYKSLKYILYYESCTLGILNTHYKVVLVDITNNIFIRHEVFIPIIPGSIIINFFKDLVFDVEIRHRRLESALYLLTKVDDRRSIVSKIRDIAND